MAVVAVLSSTSLSLPSSPSNMSISKSNSKAKISTFETNPVSSVQLYTTNSSPLSKHKSRRLFSSHVPSPKASSSSSSSVGSTDHVVEPNTNIEFETRLSLPGCSNPLSLLGTGYLEKVFSIFAVKVYAVGFYANTSIIKKLNLWKGRRDIEYQQDASFFHSIYQAPMEKALQIVMVRDIDGWTFWDAMNDAISPRIKSPTSDDKTALSTFKSIFQERSLEEDTVIFLTWLDPSKMLIHISADESQSAVDITIESTNINLALFDIFFGDAPIAPSLKDTVCKELAKMLR